MAIFTLEHLIDSGDGLVDSRLEWHGRYAHAQRYVERVLAAAGLEPHLTEAELRMEAGAPVAGLVVRGTAPRTFV